MKRILRLLCVVILSSVCVSAVVYGIRNTYYGYLAGSHYVGDGNTAIGWYAMGRTTGYGDNNTAIGVDAGSRQTAGISNTFVGASAGSSVTTGRNNVFIGHGAGGNSNTTGSVAIGYGATPPADHTAVIGGSDSLGAIYSIYMGQGYQRHDPMPFLFSATNGSGVNNEGGALYASGGRGTGNAVGGEFRIYVSGAGASGSSLNPLVERIRVGVGGTTVTGSLYATSFIGGGLGVRVGDGVTTVPSYDIAFASSGTMVGIKVSQNSTSHSLVIYGLKSSAETSIGLVGTKLPSSTANTSWTAIINSLTTYIRRDGSQSATGSHNWGGYNLIGVGAFGATTATITNTSGTAATYSTVNVTSLLRSVTARISGAMKVSGSLSTADVLTTGTHVVSGNLTAGTNTANVHTLNGGVKITSGVIGSVSQSGTSVTLNSPNASANVAIYFGPVSANRVFWWNKNSSRFSMTGGGLQVNGATTATGNVVLGATTANVHTLNGGVSITSGVVGNLNVGGQIYSPMWTTTYGSSMTIPLSQGGGTSVTVTGSGWDITFTGSALSGGEFILNIIQDGTGGRTGVIGEAGVPVLFPGKVHPVFTSTANAIDVLIFKKSGTRMILTNVAYDEK